MFAEAMQLDTLYWPVVQTEQLVQFETAVTPDPVEYVPVWQVVHGWAWLPHRWACCFCSGMSSPT